MNRKSVTMKDIAAATGLSVSSVSQIFNGREALFPEQTVRLVRAKAEELGYVFRRQGRPVQSDILLVLCTTLTNPFYSAMIQNITQLAVPQGIQIAAAASYHNPKLEHELLQSAFDCHCRGVIFLYPPDDVPSYDSMRQKLPIVSLCNSTGDLSGDSIQIDNFEAGSTAARHLLSLGHRHIAVLTNAQQDSFSSNATRLRGIRSETDRVIPRDNLLILRSSAGWKELLSDPHIQMSTGYRLIQSDRFLSSGCTGIICTNDHMAYGAMKYLTEQGYRIPEDFSIIGCDGQAYSSMPQISLTSVDLHLDIIATAAFNALMNRIAMQSLEGSSDPVARLQIRCTVDLIERGSTGPAPSRSDN